MGTVERNRALRHKAIHDLKAGDWSVQEIAVVLGVRRETVYQALRRLQSAARIADAEAIHRDTARLHETLSREI